MRIAVITGASSGMGREFVYALDREEQFDEIWVIARREYRLEELKAKCRNPIRPLVWDLEKRESLYAYRELLEKEQPVIDVLVNAAGFGLFGTFEEMDLDRQLDIIDLNSRALTGMCYLSVPYMKAGGRKGTGEAGHPRNGGLPRLDHHRVFRLRRARRHDQILQSLLPAREGHRQGDQGYEEGQKGLRSRPPGEAAGAAGQAPADGLYYEHLVQTAGKVRDRHVSAQ